MAKYTNMYKTSDFVPNNAGHNPDLNYENDRDFKSARTNLNNAASAAMPSQQSLDRASARVRARLAAQTNANQQSISDRFAGSGNMGGLNKSYAQNFAAGQSAYGQALGDLEQQWWDKQQKGAEILSGIGQRFGDMGNNIGNLVNEGSRVANDFALGKGEIGVKLEDIGRRFATDERKSDITENAAKMDSIVRAMEQLFASGNTVLTPEKAPQLEEMIKSLFGLTGTAYSGGMNTGNIRGGLGDTVDWTGTGGAGGTGGLKGQVELMPSETTGLKDIGT